MVSRHAPIPRKGSGKSNNNSKIEIADTLLRNKGSLRIQTFLKLLTELRHILQLAIKDSVTNYLYKRNTTTHNKSIY